MTITIRDLAHRFDINGTAYVAEVCCTEGAAAPVSAGPFDITVTLAAPGHLRDFDDDEPHLLAASLVQETSKYIPGASKDALDEFYRAVYGWIFEHRADAALGGDVV